MKSSGHFGALKNTLINVLRLEIPETAHQMTLETGSVMNYLCNHINSHLGDLLIVFLFEQSSG